MKRSKKLMLVLLSTLGLLILCSVVRASVLDRGHRVLLESGLQVQALGFVVETGYFDTARWAESNFTTLDSFYYGYAGELPAIPPGIRWSRWAHPNELSDPASFDLLPSERPFAANLIRLQVRDEQDITTSTNLAVVATVVENFHTKYPNVIVHTNQFGSQFTAAEIRHYMAYVKPDMLMFDTYPFNGNVTGGSPTTLYRDLEQYRDLGLNGNDGSGSRPIPTGLYTQTYIRSGHIVSESEIRLNSFAAWAFGYKLVDAFVYDDPQHNPDVQPVMFSGDGTANPTPQFYQVAECNRQSVNLGPALVRLISTDLRMKMGRHKGLFNLSIISNALPAGVSSWNPGADPFIASITATNLGGKNNGLEGDVIVGYFKPLDGSFTNAGHEDDIYFMIVNGLSSASGTAVDCQQLIKLTFDFGDSGIDSLLRLSRETGNVEVVTLAHLSDSQYSLQLYIDGGTGDLFKFNNGGIFIPEPSSIYLIGIGALAMILVWRRDN